MESVMKLTCPKCQNGFDIDDEIEQFACAGCGTEYTVKRSGGIVRLKEMAQLSQRAALLKEIEDLELTLKAERQCEMAGMPGALLLRFDYARIGKLHLQFATVAPEKILFGIFDGLSVDDLERMADYYADNPSSPTGAWLRRMCDLTYQIEEKRQHLTAQP